MKRFKQNILQKDRCDTATAVIAEDAIKASAALSTISYVFKPDAYPLIV